MNLGSAILFFLSAVGLLVVGHRTTHGCAMAPPRDEDVTITDETALIVWDSASKTEHFIRNANFETTARDFGFLVPTPTIPTLHESGGRVLSSLAELTRARVEFRPVVTEKFRLFKPGTGFDFFQNVLATSEDTTAMPSGAVQVIRQEEVAGYEATVLKASDSEELLEWLNQHDYVASPELLSWLEAYTQQGWYITAFRISQSADSTRPGLTARPVRITFQTDRPFYPYREPQNDAKSETPSIPSLGTAARLLRLYVLADQKMEGRLGHSDVVPAQTVWAGQIKDWHLENLNWQFPRKDNEAELITHATQYLTEFEDHSSPRPGTDELFLVPAVDQSPVERPPIIREVARFNYRPDFYKAPFWLLLFFVVGAVVCRRRKRGRAEPTGLTPGSDL